MSDKSVNGHGKQDDNRNIDEEMHPPSLQEKDARDSQNQQRHEDATTTTNLKASVGDREEHQQQEDKQQVQALLEAIHILSQLALMDTSRYLATRNNLPNAQVCTEENPQLDKRHAVLLQQRLDQLGQQWNLEDTGIASLNHAIHRWHSHGLEYQTLLDQQESELRQLQDQLRHMQEVKIPKYQDKLTKYKQRARIWQAQYHQQQQQRKSILKVAKDYIHNIHRGTAKQLAEAQMAYQVQVHEHALKLQAHHHHHHHNYGPNQPSGTTTSNDGALMTPPIAKRLSFQKQKTSQTQQQQQQQQQKLQQQQQQSSSTMNRMRTFSKESTASSDLSDGLDFQYDQEDVLHRLNEFEEELGGDPQDLDDGLSVTSSSSTCSLVTDQGVATIQLAPTHSSSSNSSAVSMSSPFTAEKRGFSMPFMSSSSPSALHPQPIVEMPTYTIQVAIGSLWFCKVPKESTPSLPVETPPPPPPLPQEPKNAKATPKGLISLDATTENNEDEGREKGRKSAQQEEIDGNAGSSTSNPRTDSVLGLSMSHSNHAFQSSMKSLGLGGLLMGKQSQQQHNQQQVTTADASENTTGSGLPTVKRSNVAVAVAAPEYIFLVCGFQYPAVPEVAEESDPSSNKMVLPTLGARLVAIEGQNLFVTEYMTLEDLQKIVLANAKPLTTKETKVEMEETGPLMVTMSFRDEVLTKAQQRLLDKAVAEKQRIMSSTSATFVTNSSVSKARIMFSLPLTGIDKDVEKTETSDASQRQPNMLFQSFFKLTNLASNVEASPNGSKKVQTLNDSSISDLIQMVKAPLTDEGNSTTTDAPSLRGIKFPLFLKSKQQDRKTDAVVTDFSSENHDDNCANKQPQSDPATAPVMEETHPPAAETKVASTNPTSSVTRDSGLQFFLKPKQPKNNNGSETQSNAVEDSHDAFSTTNINCGNVKRENSPGIFVAGCHNDNETENIIPMTTDVDEPDVISGSSGRLESNSVHIKSSRDNDPAVLDICPPADESGSRPNTADASNENELQDRTDESTATKLHASMKHVGRFFGGFRVAD